MDNVSRKHCPRWPGEVLDAVGLEKPSVALRNSIGQFGRKHERARVHVEAGAEGKQGPHELVGGDHPNLAREGPAPYSVLFRTEKSLIAILSQVAEQEVGIVPMMSLREPGERILHERVVVGQHHHYRASGLGSRALPA